ncbi:hypothetical protein Trydic_g1784 [Trypoxylus dichotomus]
MKLREAKDLEIFLGEFDEVIRQLQVTGADLKKEDMVCSLLLAMPPSLKTITTVIENMSEADITLEVVKAKLRDEVEGWEAENGNNELGQKRQCKACCIFHESVIKTEVEEIEDVNQDSIEVHIVVNDVDITTDKVQEGIEENDRRGNYADNHNRQSESEEQGICFMTNNENEQDYIVMVFVKCAVHGCGNKSSPRHRFPNPRIRPASFRAWVAACANEVVPQNNPQLVHKTHSVCHVHFRYGDRASNSFLKKNAVPSLFLPAPVVDGREITLAMVSDSSIILLEVLVPGPRACFTKGLTNTFLR